MDDAQALKDSEAVHDALGLHAPAVGVPGLPGLPAHDVWGADGAQAVEALAADDPAVDAQGEDPRPTRPLRRAAASTPENSRASSLMYGLWEVESRLMQKHSLRA